MENLFHKHNYKTYKRSNVIQLDDMGYPLRLVILKCSCGATEQAWLDTNRTANDVVLKWDKDIE